MAAAAAAGPPPFLPESVNEKIKGRLQQKGMLRPTPKMIHNLRKKHLQKLRRKSKRLVAISPSLPESQQKILAEECYFRTLSREYKHITKILASKSSNSSRTKMVGRPWEQLEREKLREFASESQECGGVRNLKGERLRELGLFFEERKREALSLLLDDDVNSQQEKMLSGSDHLPRRPSRSADMDSVRFLVDRLCSAPAIASKDWKFAKLMKQSRLRFTEAQMLDLVGKLGERGSWRHAMGVVQWVYNQKEHKFYKSRFVYTKLLAVLGKARRPHDALRIFHLMLGDCHIYPDMAAYHSIAVTLGQAGLLKELLKIVECMKQKPSERIKNALRKNWDPTLQPDVIVFNAVLNACIPSHQWKGVPWVFEQLRKSGIRPNAATYGLSMEVMLHARKFELVHELLQRMKKSGAIPHALAYRVLVKTLWEEDKVDEAIEAVRDMEHRGITGTASVYYELACCLCNNGRWQEAIKEIERLKNFPYSKQIAVAFTGMIKSSMDGGHVNSCISVFEYMKLHYGLNVGAANVMLEVYSQNDMFSEAKELFEKTKSTESGHRTCSYVGNGHLSPDIHLYVSMLKACARAQQWEYFEYVYKEMTLYGHRLNQSKHALLLVEASRAGKWHLLEHAFDAVLESGETPNESLFSEMVCQTTSRGDYVGCAAIVNAMAHAPFKLSCKEWSNLFEENKDRINEESLARLADMLSDSNMVKEASTTNLLKSLQSVCCSAIMKDIPAANSSITGASNSSQKENDEVNHTVLDVQKAEMGMKDIDSAVANPRHLRCLNSFAYGTILEDKLDVKTCDWDLSYLDEASDDCLDSIGLMDDSEVSDLPSAVEILEAWNESRRKDRREGFSPSFCW